MEITKYFRIEHSIKSWIDKLGVEKTSSHLDSHLGKTAFTEKYETTVNNFISESIFINIMQADTEKKVLSIYVLQYCLFGGLIVAFLLNANGHLLTAEVEY